MVLSILTDFLTLTNRVLKKDYDACNVIPPVVQNPPISAEAILGTPGALGKHSMGASNTPLTLHGIVYDLNFTVKCKFIISTKKILLT